MFSTFTSGAGVGAGTGLKILLFNLSLKNNLEKNNDKLLGFFVILKTSHVVFFFIKMPIHENALWEIQA